MVKPNDQSLPASASLEGDERAGQHATLPRVRYRIRFGKRGVLRYTSHLDLARTWERTLRRAGAPLVYSQGFNPRPQMQLAAALPLGFESACELLDIWLEGSVPEPGELLAALRRAAPEGLEVEGIWAVDLRGPALQTLTRSATYEVVPGEEIAYGELAERAAALLAQNEVRRERRGKTYDLRPLILATEALPGEPPRLRLELSLSADQGTGRPDEVLTVLGLDPLSARVTRTAITCDDSAG